MSATAQATSARPRVGRAAKTVKLEIFRPACPRFWRVFRSARRIVLLLLWNFISYPILGVLYLAPGDLNISYPMFYWRISCWLLGMKVRVIGKPATGDRPVIFCANHSSWLDIVSVGSVLRASFISKGEVENWPIIGTMAITARTVFVSRSRSSTGRERDEIRTRLDEGDNLILFPEGTSSDGARVLPFRSSFFAVAAGKNVPLFQPVSVVYDQLAGLPALSSTRPIFAWYGDMELMPHLWCLAQWRSFRVTILLHPTLDPSDFANRKELAAAVQKSVAEGAAALRQHREVTVA